MLENINQTKLFYEVAKLVNPTKVILDDFTSGIALTIFREYISSFDDPKQALTQYLDVWEANIVKDKVEEISTLEKQSDSLETMAVCANITSTEGIEDFKTQVSEIKQLIFENVMRGIDRG